MRDLLVEKHVLPRIGLPYPCVFAVMTCVMVVAFRCSVMGDIQHEYRNPENGISGTENDIDMNYVVCGPRCVQYLLNYYGQEADLIDLVKEMQWPTIEAGSSMETIEKALNKRGIHTVGMTVAEDARLQWPHPVVVHMKVEGNKTGHFLVWPSPSTETNLFWCGLRGNQEISDSDFTKRFSGAILLTSPEPILNPGAAVKPSGVPAFVWWICCVGLLFVFAIVAIVRKRT